MWHIQSNPGFAFTPNVISYKIHLVYMTLSLFHKFKSCTEHVRNIYGSTCANRFYMCTTLAFLNSPQLLVAKLSSGEQMNKFSA